MKTIALLTPEQVDEAANRSVDYRPPGADLPGHMLRTTDRSVADNCFSMDLQSAGSFTTSFPPHLRPLADRLPRRSPRPTATR